MSSDKKNEVIKEVTHKNIPKKRLTDVIGILGPIPDEIKEKSKGKSYQMIKEEAIMKYFQEKCEESK